MTYMSSVRLRGWVRFTQSWRRHCVRRLASTCKTKLWNKAGIKPSMTDALTCAARLVDPDAVVWRGDWALPQTKQGLKVLGVPIGHPSFITAHMAAKFKEQALLFERIPLIEDVQVGCSEQFHQSTRQSTRNSTIRVCYGASAASCRWMGCLRKHMRQREMGCLGVGGCSRIRHAAHWGSWADCLEMVKDRHPQVAEDIIRGMNLAHGHMAVVEESGARLREVGLDTPGKLWQMG